MNKWRNLRIKLESSENNFYYMWAPNLTRKFIEQLVAENVTQEKNNEDSNSENCMLEEYNSEDARS